MEVTAIQVPAKRPAALERSLRRAISFIEANVDRDIGAADIATGAHVTVRAVQLALKPPVMIMSLARSTMNR